jgi:hypothetical protein
MAVHMHSMAFCLKVQQIFISAHVDILVLNKAKVQRVGYKYFYRSPAAYTLGSKTHKYIQCIKVTEKKCHSYYNVMQYTQSNMCVCLVTELYTSWTLISLVTDYTDPQFNIVSWYKLYYK